MCSDIHCPLQRSHDCPRHKGCHILFLLLPFSLGRLPLLGLSLLALVVVVLLVLLLDLTLRYLGPYGYL